MKTGSRLTRAARLTPSLTVGIVIVAIVALAAIFAPLIAPFNPETTSAAVLVRPSPAHWLGTDDTGMDILSRILYAPRVDLTIALLATALSVAAGTAVGVAAGYYRSWPTEVAMRISDLLQSFPVYVLGMALVVLTGHNIETLVVAIAVISAPVYARLVRSEVLQLRERLFVEALRATGVSSKRILLRHVLPNATSPIFSMSSVTMGTSVLVTAGLSFIGAGVRIPTPEWGSMISIGTPDLISGAQWWPSVFPGVALAVTVLGFALVGDSLPKVLDRRNRARGGRWALPA